MGNRMGRESSIVSADLIQHGAITRHGAWISRRSTSRFDGVVDIEDEMQREKLSDNASKERIGWSFF